MSKEQVELDYQKLLWKRWGLILKEYPKTRLGRMMYRGTAHYYTMPVMPLDEDFRPKIKD